MAKWSKSEKPWERQQGESTQAFEAFDLYCKMGTERSIRKVAQELGKSSTLMSRWSSAWSWQSRSREYDNELKRREFAEAQKAQKKMQERQIQTAMLLQKKAVQALDKLQVEDLAPKDILRFISEGAKLEAMNRTASTQQTAREAGDDGQTSTLADTIIAAYQRRTEGSGND